MKKAHKIILLSGFITFITLISLTYYFSPYWALYQIKEALINNDKQQFNDHIDYFALRRNLKQNLEVTIPTPENPQVLDKKMISFLNTLIKKKTEEMIESKITSEKLLTLIKQQISINDSLKDIKVIHKSTNPESIVDKKYLLEYPNLDHFNLILNTEKNLHKKIKIIFERKGLIQWKITDINLE